MITNPEERANDISRRVEVLASSLSTRIDPRTASRKVRSTPLKALVRREALAWRFVDLCRGALVAYREGYFASAVVLTRAALETTGALWYLNTKIESVLETGTLTDIDTYLTQMVLGSRTVPKAPDPVNVLTFIQKLDKKYDGALRQYEELSEFAHPNWSGTLLLYSKPNDKDDWVDFGKEVRDLEGVRQICTVNLDVALMIFDGCYTEILDLMPRFIKICERG